MCVATGSPVVVSQVPYSVLVGGNASGTKKICNALIRPGSDGGCGQENQSWSGETLTEMPRRRWSSEPKSRGGTASPGITHCQGQMTRMEAGALRQGLPFMASAPGTPAHQPQDPVASWKAATSSCSQSRSAAIRGSASSPGRCTRS